MRPKGTTQNETHIHTQFDTSETAETIRSILMIEIINDKKNARNESKISFTFRNTNV